MIRIKKQLIMNGTSCTQPQNFYKIDDFTLRSAAPKGLGEVIWLKDQARVNYVLDYRTLQEIRKSGFNEKKYLSQLDIGYQNIPLYSKNFSISDSRKVSKAIEKLKKTHPDFVILNHCSEGVDRTGEISLNYKSKYKIGNIDDNIEEMIKYGHHHELFPDLIKIARRFDEEIKNPQFLTIANENKTIKRIVNLVKNIIKFEIKGFTDFNKAIKTFSYLA